jgi:excisionase family DNA binding protein
MATTSKAMTTGAGGFMRPKEVAEFLGVSRAWVDALVDRKELPCVRLGPRTRRIPRQAVEEYAERLLRARGDGG